MAAHERGRGAQETLFGGLTDTATQQVPRRLTVLLTVQAAPNPSLKHGETVCVAGLGLRPDSSFWVRLYPINARHLTADQRFKKYDIVEVDARPAKGDVRAESWTPDMRTMTKVAHLKPWLPRRPFLDPVVEQSMCAVRDRARREPQAPSLALVSARTIDGIDLESHPGWTREEQAKIDAYVSQLELFETVDKTPLEAPRFIGSYRWRCWDPGCTGHRQRILDWEFVALQRHLRLGTDEEVTGALRSKWLDQVCAGNRQVSFYVGNQAKRHHTFSILGVYWPKVG